MGSKFYKIDCLVLKQPSRYSDGSEIKLEFTSEVKMIVVLIGRVLVRIQVQLKDEETITHEATVGVAKREMRHRGSLQLTCSKKRLTASEVPMTTRNGETHRAKDNTPSENWEIKTKRFNGEKGVLHRLPKMAVIKNINFPDLRVLAEQADPQAAFKTALLQVEAAIRRLERHISEVEADHSAWLEYIKQLRAAAEKANEASIYQTLAEAPDSFLIVIKGKAREAVGGFTVAPENYGAVKTMLQQRFGGSELLLKSLYAELHDATTPTKDFEECVASVERILQQLEQQGENIDNSQTELCIEKRLPRSALLEVEQAKEADAAWSVRKLRDKVQAIVRISENMRTATIRKPTHEGWQAQRQVGRREQRNLGGVKLEESLHHTSALPAVAKRQTKGKDRRHDLTRQVCAFCSEPHWVDSCPRFTTLKERFDRARQSRLCFKCLREGHNQNDCTRNVSCYHCKRKEHPTAHPSQQGKEENPVGETHTQTIRTVAAIATPEQQERDKTQLGIEVTHKESLIVDGFGGTHITHGTSARVKLKMRRTDGRLFTMFANSVSRLVSEIAIAKLTEKTLRRIRSTRNITLPMVTLKPQILVGADYFHEIFRGSASTKLPSGFHLIRTCLGDMISGQGRSSRHGTFSKIKPANHYCRNVASAKDELEKFWSLELAGVKDPPLQMDDELAMKRQKKRRKGKKPEPSLKPVRVRAINRASDTIRHFCTDEQRPDELTVSRMRKIWPRPVREDTK
uniref:CCHC-type domain-containing protein n=1 Tax=Parascaris univalens TaxID=6257 RepID=A0A915BS15_PARUN